jgi:hypothetical protein
MYSIDEAITEHNEKLVTEGGESERNEFNNHVVKRLPSFRPKLEKDISRQPSFFQKMFSSRKINRISALDEDEEDEDDGNNDGAPENTGKGEAAGGKADPEEDEEEKQDDKEEQKYVHGADATQVANRIKPGDHHSHLTKKDLSDPLTPEGPTIPMIGKPIQMERLINRNRTAEVGLTTLMSMVNRDVEVSLFDSKHIPVGKDHDRVIVTPEISNYMSKIRTHKQIDRHVKSNMQNIQKALNCRKSSIIIMNSNYSNELVRKIEPIYTQEARTTVIFK